MVIIYIISVFLAFIGLVSVIRGMCVAFFKMKNNCYTTNLLLTIKNDDKICDIELETKIALSRLRWYNNSIYDNIYVVGCNLCESNFKKCIEYCKNYDVELLKYDDLIKKIGNGYEQ